MTDNKNIFTNNKKSDNQNVKDNLLIDELDTYSDYVHEFSDSYKNRKEEFLRSLESVNEHKATGKENTVIKNLNNNRKISSIRSIKRVFTRKYDRIAAAVILLMILIPCTVLAAEKIVSYYNINIKKTGNYSYDLGLRKDSDYNANTKFHTNVKINFNTDLRDYDIETDGSNYKLSYAGNDNLKDKNISVMLIGLNDNEDIQLKYITDVKEIEYSDKKVVWFTHSYGENVVNTNNGNYVSDIFAIYSDYGYAIEIKAQNNTSEDLLQELIKNIELVECDESEAAKANYRIYRDEYVKEDNEDIYAGEYTDISYKLNDKFNMPDMDMYSSNKLEYTVNNYTVISSIQDLQDSLINEENNNISDKSNWISSELSCELINEDGTFIKYKRPVTYNMGDGVSTLNSYYEAENISTRLVLVDISVENTSDEYIQNVRLIPQICSLYRHNGRLMIPRECYSNSFVNSEGYPLCVMFKSSLGIVRDAQSVNRTSVNPNENIHIIAGYLVDEDRLDDMLLFYNSYGSLTYKKGKLASIKLK